MGIHIHRDLVQGTEEWLAARTGILTASEMKLILTPGLKIADNDKERTHLYELLAQRISGFVEDSYVGFDMLRGREDELEARILYNDKYAPVEEVGFITNNKFGFVIGYSPDGLVGDDGLIECKSRKQKYQVQTVIEHAAVGNIPPEYMLQIQTGLLVSERQWCDFVSYSGGLPLIKTRVFPDPKIQDAIITAATAFEMRLAEKRAAWEAYVAKLRAEDRFIPTERRVEQEMFA